MKMIEPGIPLVIGKPLVSNEFSVKGNVLKFKCMKCGRKTTLTISGSIILDYKVIHCTHCCVKHINPAYLGYRIS